MRHVAAMNKRLENAIDGRFGNVCSLIDLLERPRSILLLHQFQNIERLGQDGNHVQSAAERSGHNWFASTQVALWKYTLALNFNTDIHFGLTGVHSGSTVSSRCASRLRCLVASGVTDLL